MGTDKYVIDGYVYIKDEELEKFFHYKIPKEFPRWRKNQIKKVNFIWWINTGEIIKPPEFIIHKNKDKTDDRFENLEKTNRSKHAKEHAEEYLEKRKLKLNY